MSQGEITSLNSGTTKGNTAYNQMPVSLTSMGFAYYDSNAKLVRNTNFGTMKVVKNTAKDFQIAYTVRKGQVWSDGTPIDAVDLLLSHIVRAEKWSKAAGLGDPTNATDKLAFESVSYGAAYGEHVVGDPKLSADKMTLTVKFGQPMPDWELLAPGPSPVHALSLIADGKKGLQSAAVNKAAKDKFLAAFTKKTTATLKKMGAAWSTGYDVANIDASTNKLLLISNGGFMVSKLTAGSSMTLVRNAKYTSGPKMATKNPIKTVVIKIIKDNTASVQALRNGDIDVYYNTLPTGADKTALSAMPNVTVLTKTGGNYSHLHLRTDTAFGNSDQYTGPFAGSSQRAKDLRKAFLLAVPREQMVATLIKPIKPDATTLDTQFAFQGTPEYSTITKGSGVSVFTQGTQADRTAAALAIVKKYYPTASADKPAVDINFAYANVTVRNALAALITAEAKKAGFNVISAPQADLFGSGSNSSAKYDVTMYGFGLNSLSQANGTEIFKSNGGNNVWGWNDSRLDTILASLQGDILTAKQATEKRLAADKIIMSNAWGLALYANPTITAYNKALKNVKPAPVGNNITWNFFEWSY
jgi:peptide/nickel transport system substrate-binding protein